MPVASPPAPVTTSTAAGVPLGAPLFLPPAGQVPRAAAPLNPTTGARRRCYEPFARYLAAAGFAGRWPPG